MDIFCLRAMGLDVGRGPPGALLERSGHASGKSTTGSGQSPEDSVDAVPPPSRVAQAPFQRRLLFLDVDGVLHPLRVRLMVESQTVDLSHCFQPSCMQQLRRVVDATGAELVLSSSWRAFEHSRELAAQGLAKYDLAFRQCTTVSGGDSNAARVDQILAFVNNAGPDVGTWIVVDDEDLAPSATAGDEGMLRALFRQRFVRTRADVGLDEAAANLLIAKLLACDSDSDSDGGK